MAGEILTPEPPYASATNIVVNSTTTNEALFACAFEGRHPLVHDAFVHPLIRIRAADELGRRLKFAIASLLIPQARSQKSSWEEIGSVLRISKQAAWQQYKDQFAMYCVICGKAPLEESRPTIADPSVYFCEVCAFASDGP